MRSWWVQGDWRPLLGSTLLEQWQGPEQMERLESPEQLQHQGPVDSRPLVHP